MQSVGGRTGARTLATLLSRSKVPCSPPALSRVVPTSIRACTLLNLRGLFQTPEPPPMEKASEVPLITYEELKPITKSPTESVLLLDVRAPWEFAEGNIPSSVNLPIQQLEYALTLDPPLFTKVHGFKKPVPEQDIVTICQSGDRSETALRWLRAKGFKHVRNYAGWKDWFEREKDNTDDD